MSVFGVFATVLTIIYVIYYAWMIGRDLYGKKDQQTSKQETFAVATDETEEVITEVREIGDGFSFSTDPEEEEAAVESHTETTDSQEEEADEEVDAPTQADHAIVTLYKEGMEEIKPEHSKEFESSEFINALMNIDTVPGNLLKTTRNEL
ncbi:MAG: hypothetical protein PHX50_10085 [Massilibacteroides sp.]|nr:hypothetical protein [Massilibacteroides sp.]